MKKEKDCFNCRFSKLAKFDPTGSAKYNRSRTRVCTYFPPSWVDGYCRFPQVKSDEYCAQFESKFSGSDFIVDLISD